MKYIINVGILFIFIAAMMILYKYKTGEKNEILQKILKEFPAVAIDEKLENSVVYIFHPYPESFNNDPMQAYILLKDSSKLRIKAGYELSNNMMLDNILQIGDYLVKDYGSEVLYVYKLQGSDTAIYSFQLRDDLGYPLNKR